MPLTTESLRPPPPEPPGYTVTISHALAVEYAEWKRTPDDLEAKVVPGEDGTAEVLLRKVEPE